MTVRKEAIAKQIRRRRWPVTQLSPTVGVSRLGGKKLDDHFYLVSFATGLSVIAHTGILNSWVAGVQFERYYQFEALALCCSTKVRFSSDGQAPAFVCEQCLKPATHLASAQRSRFFYAREPLGAQLEPMTDTFQVDAEPGKGVELEEILASWSTADPLTAVVDASAAAGELALVTSHIRQLALEGIERLKARHCEQEAKKHLAAKK